MVYFSQSIHKVIVGSEGRGPFKLEMGRKSAFSNRLWQNERIQHILSMHIDNTLTIWCSLRFEFRASEIPLIIMEPAISSFDTADLTYEWRS